MSRRRQEAWVSPGCVDDELVEDATELTAAAVKARAREIGFDLCGVAPVGEHPELGFLERWLAEGRAGDMRYMGRTAARRQDVRRVLASARAVISLATVYNTLRAFCDAGLMREITVDGSKSYFDTNTTSHPHYYWEDTGAVTDAPADQLQIARLPDAPAGTEIANVGVVIRLRRT